MPRVILVTNDSPYGRRVLDAVGRRAIMLDAVVYLTGSLALPRIRGMGLAGRVLRWPLSAATVALRKRRFHRARRAAYARHAARVVEAGGLGDPSLPATLRDLAPDWLVLGGGGILGAELLATAREGVLNAHPALLPWIRGTGVTGASLEHGVALGATLHRADPGIDTGAVIARRLAAVRPEDADLARLERATHALAAEMLADAVEGIVRRGEAPVGEPQTARYPLFRWPDAAGMRRHHALAAAGRAHALYEAWRPLCTDPAHGTLPDGPLDAPPTMTLASRRAPLEAPPEAPPEAPAGARMTGSTATADRIVQRAGSGPHD